MPFEHIDAVDITDYVIENSLNINFRVELDDPLNFVSTSGSVEIVESGYADIAEILNPDDLINNVLIVQVLNSSGGGEFLGIVNTENSYFDNIERVYHLSFYDYL